MDLAAIKIQTMTYVYDLMNEAKEHGFKADDTWELSLVSETDRVRIQKDYYPAVASKVVSGMLLQVFQSVKSELHLPLSQHEEQMNAQSILHEGLQYIIAFNPKRARH
jgi:hypothetical protein